MTKTSDLTTRERLIRAGVLLPAQRDVRDLPPPLPPRDGVQLSEKLQQLRDEERW